MAGFAFCAKAVIRYTLTLEGYSTLWFLPAMFLSECLFFVLRRSPLPNWLCVAALLLEVPVIALIRTATPFLLKWPGRTKERA